ncbi:MAG: starch-binding protein, partial [Eubacteriales bacterium]|nr:starch-binding protein [Eubacteriales bacterium]
MSKTKKIISVILAVALVMTMATVAIVSASAADTVKVYFENTSWGAIYAYVWGGADGEALGAWPGAACTDEGNGIWSVDIPADCTNVIFNNNSGSQTNNMENPGQTMIAKLTGSQSQGDYQMVDDAAWEAYGAPETTAAP